MVQHMMHNDSMMDATQGRQGEGSNPPRLVQAVERALNMLEEVAASPAALSATQIASRAGVNRGTAWRLLTTLEHFHLVERDSQSGKYFVGYGPARIAQASAAPALIRRARPVLEALGAELNESVYLQVATGTRLVVLDEVAAPRPVRVDLARMEVPLHCGSVGKLFLAFLPEAELAEILAQPLERFTERTITDPTKLRQAIEKARRERIAWAYKEHLPDWAGATTVACDRRGLPLAYLNVSVPAYRYSQRRLMAMRQPLLAAAASLEARLLP